MDLEPAATEGLRATISRRMVSLLKEFYGRGPESAKTYIHADYVLVIFIGGYSKVEETLLAAGEGRVVTDQRDRFQALMRDRFVSTIEELTGRTVVSFMSTNDQQTDVMAELFLTNAPQPTP